MTISVFRGAMRRLTVALTLAAGLVGIAPLPASAQGIPEIRVPNFRVPVVRAPDIRLPDVGVPDVRIPKFTPAGIPDLGDALVFYGNYCGPGNRGPGKRPIDALDAACMRHDSCTPPLGQPPSCGCNARLRREATAVALSPRTRDDTRAAALFITESTKLVECR